MSRGRKRRRRWEIVISEKTPRRTIHFNFLGWHRVNDNLSVSRTVKTFSISLFQNYARLGTVSVFVTNCGGLRVCLYFWTVGAIVWLWSRHSYFPFPWNMFQCLFLLVCVKNGREANRKISTEKLRSLVGRKWGRILRMFRREKKRFRQIYRVTTAEDGEMRSKNYDWTVFLA